MEIRKMNPQVDIETGYEDDKLAQITIRHMKGGELGYEELMYASAEIRDFARREFRPPILRRSGHTAAVQQMVEAYDKGRGISDEYLARLAVAYGELAPSGRSVSTGLALALNKPLPTVKGHIMRARQQGFLSEAVEGREGGEATEKARTTIADLDKH